MGNHEIRVGPVTDSERFVASDDLVWFNEPSTLTLEEKLVGVPPDQRFAADVDGADPATYPGVYGVRPMTLALPGCPGANLVPAAGLTWVGVHPDHRRRGVLSAMMRDHLARVHEQQDVHLSVLHASEPGIYGRYGYGLGALELDIWLGRGTTFTAPHLGEAASAVTTQLASSTDAGAAARLRDCDLRIAAHTPGWIVGELAFYRAMFQQPPEDLRDKEPLRFLFARRDGEDVGVAVFRRTHKWERARPSGEVEVHGVAGDEAARLALLRRLVDLDLIGTVKIHLCAADDPVLTWIGGPRAASSVDVYDATWVRLVDLGPALAARHWSATCDLVLDVADAFAPWNQGRWRVSAAGGAVTTARTEDEPDVSLPVEALGAAFLGGGGLVARLRAGHLVEHRPGAVVELERALRTDPGPVPSMGF